MRGGGKGARSAWWRVGVSPTPSNPKDGNAHPPSVTTRTLIPFSPCTLTTAGGVSPSCSHGGRLWGTWRKGSAVSFLAVENALDFEVVVVLPEEDAVILGAEADQGRGDAVELLGCAFAGKDVAAQSLENLDGDGLFEAADVSLGLVRPDDAYGLGFAAHLLPVSNREAELGEHLFMGDRFVVLTPFVGFSDRLGFSGTERVVVFVEEHFQEIAHCAKLGGRQQIDE